MLRGAAVASLVVAPGPCAAASARTLSVCGLHPTHGCFHRIQQAVDAARPGDTIRVPHGRYREAIAIRGRAKRSLRLVGDRLEPGRVVLEGGGVRGIAVLVSGADHVTVRGFLARRYTQGGFVVRGVRGATLRNVVAARTGTFGVRLAGVAGATIADAAAGQNAGAGFSIAGTPVEAHPVRTVLRRVSAYANPIGFDGRGARGVTLVHSLWFDNATGIALRGAATAGNVVIDNDVFWNNFDVYAGAPYVPRPGPPVGTGIAVSGARDTVVAGNRLWGNFLVGVLVTGAGLRGAQVRGNDFGISALAEEEDIEDLDGRDIAVTGEGSAVCVAGNVLRSPTVPADGSTFAACPHTGAGAVSEDARAEVARWAADATHEAYWIRHEHEEIEGFDPLERWPG